MTKSFSPTNCSTSSPTSDPLWTLCVYGKQSQDLSFLSDLAFSSDLKSVLWNPDPLLALHECASLCVFIWEDFVAEKLDALFELLSYLNPILSRKVVYVRGEPELVSNLTAEHEAALRECGIEDVFKGLQKQKQLTDFALSQAKGYLKLSGELSRLLAAGDNEALATLLAPLSGFGSQPLGSQPLGSQHAVSQRAVSQRAVSQRATKRLAVRTYMAARDWLRAQACLQALIRSDKADLWAVNMLAKVYWYRKKFAYALELWRRLDYSQGLRPQEMFELRKLYIKGF